MRIMFRDMFFYTTRRRNKYNDVISAGESGTYKGFGVCAIVYSLLAMAAVCLLMLVGPVIGFMEGGLAQVLLGALGIVFIAIIGIAMPLCFIFFATVNTCYQLKLRRSAMGWVALAVTILGFIGTVGLVFVAILTL